MEMNNQQNNMNNIDSGNKNNNMDNILGEELNSDGGIENITKNVSLALATSLLANEQATIDNSTQIAGNADNLQKLAQMVISMQDQINSLLSGSQGGQGGQNQQMAMGSINPTNQGAQPQQTDPMEAIRILAQGQLANQQGQGQNVSGR